MPHGGGFERPMGVCFEWQPVNSDPDQQGVARSPRKEKAPREQGFENSKGRKVFDDAVAEVLGQSQSNRR